MVISMGNGILWCFVNVVMRKMMLVFGCADVLGLSLRCHFPDHSGERLVPECRLFAVLALVFVASAPQS